MPRIRPLQIQHARQISPYLAYLLVATRSLREAENELRWLKEKRKALGASFPAPRPRGHHVSRRHIRNHSQEHESSDWLRRACIARARGRPLQYILGSEHFGNLEIQVTPDVLIPRNDTADIVKLLCSRVHLARIASHQTPAYAEEAGKSKTKLKVLDLCTGSGCIAFLFAHALYQRRPSLEDVGIELEVLGIDISSKALQCAHANLRRLRAGGVVPPASHSGLSVDLARADILGHDDSSVPSLMDVLTARGQKEWDIIISNPPYISVEKFANETQRSVRNFEPRLALVPPVRPANQYPALADVAASSDSGTEERKSGYSASDGSVKTEDQFYASILAHAAAVGAKMILFEVGDMEQAQRVARLVHCQDQAQRTGFLQSGDGSLFRTEGVEIWRDGAVYDRSSSMLSLTPSSISGHADGGIRGQKPVIGGGTDVQRNKKVLNDAVKVVGPSEGHGRAVFAWTGEGRQWLRDI